MIRFSEVPLSLEDSKKALAAGRILKWILYLGILVFMATEIVLGFTLQHDSPSLALLVMFAYSLFGCAFVVVVHGLYRRFKPIGNDDWTYETTLRFFEQNPDFTYYQDAVVAQGREFMCGEMVQLNRLAERLHSKETEEKTYNQLYRRGFGEAHNDDNR